jgi:hypothetical protein
MKRLLLALAAVLLLTRADVLAAQVITGRVVDAETGDGLPAALIEVFDSTEARVGVALAERDGDFRVELERAGGPFRLEAGSLTHPRGSIDLLMVADDEILALAQIRLEAAPIPLDPILVEGLRSRLTPGGEWVRRHQLLGKGTFLPGAVVEAHGPASLGGYLANASGLWVRYDERGSPTLRNPESTTMSDCVITLVNRWPLNRPGIDGGPPLGFRSLDAIPLDWIAGIEIYNDYRDVPQGYWWDAAPPDSTEQCGLVNIWLWNSWR